MDCRHSTPLSLLRARCWHLILPGKRGSAGRVHSLFPPRTRRWLLALPGKRGAPAMCSPLCPARGEGGRYLCRPLPCLKEELSPPVLCVRQSLAAFSLFPTDRKAPIQVSSDRRAVCSFYLRAGEGFLPQSVRPSIRLAVCPMKKRAVSPPGPSGQRRERERLPCAAGHSRGRRGVVPCPSSLRLLLRSLSRTDNGEKKPLPTRCRPLVRERKPPRVCRQPLVGGRRGFPVRAICSPSSSICPNRQRRKVPPSHTPPIARAEEERGFSI